MSKINLDSFFSKISLRTLLIVPMVVQIVVTVGVITYLSVRTGQKNVNELSARIEEEIAERVDTKIDGYLEKPKILIDLIRNDVKNGLINLNNQTQIEKKFVNLIKQPEFAMIWNIFYTKNNGEFFLVGHRDQKSLVKEVSSPPNFQRLTYHLEGNQNNSKTGKNYVYDARKRPWYLEALKAKNPIWTEIYTFSKGSIGLSFSTPIYDQNQQIQSVLAVDLVLEGIDQFLRGIKVSPSGQVFIMERSGYLIGTSTQDSPIILGKDQQNMRVKAIDSSNEITRLSAEFLQKNFGSFSNINQVQHLVVTLKNETQLIRVHPYTNPWGLNWLIVVVIPESDVIGNVHHNRNIALILSVIATGIAIIFGIGIARWLSRPLRELSQTVEAMAQGDWEGESQTQRTQELASLTTSFQLMKQQLKISYQQLENHSKILEEKVLERTQQLQEAKEIADGANQAKSLFLANMSHELRTPLNAILGFSQILAKKPELASASQELEIINRAGEHLLNLINDVLDMSKIEAGRVTLNNNSFSLEGFLEMLQGMFELRATSKGLKFMVEKSFDLPQWIETDEHKLRQVLINLIGNALKFTESGLITLRVTSVPNPEKNVEENTPQTCQILWEVSDTGMGISEQEIGEIFQMFIQSESGRKSQQGTGLGLAISRKFVQMMGGDIIVKSTRGEGSIFSFSIPVKLCSDTDIDTLSHPPKKVIGLAPNQPLDKILVVDEVKENRLIIKSILTPLGWEVLEAENGLEAIQIWETYAPRLIWMDLRMPIMDGYEATRQIKSKPSGKDTIIIALTASALAEEETYILEAGCDDIVRKPFREETILDKISQYLGVQYIYAEIGKNPKENVPDLPSFHSTTILESNSLEGLSQEWIEKIHHAARSGDDILLIEIIQELPETHQQLAGIMTHLVNNFRLDLISDITLECLKTKL